MEEFVEQTLLYDFYGELLTIHQKEIYEDYVCNDLSISEIAEAFSISRQAAHDMVKRCRKILLGYEEKLHLVERFLNIKKQVGAIDKIITDELIYSSDQNERSRIIARVRSLTSEILEEL